MRLPSCWDHFLLDEIPFLSQQRLEWSQSKPLLGQSILHNVPFTIETLIKVDCLIQAGANVTLTRTQFIRPNETPLLHAMLEELNITYIPEHADLKKHKTDFDIVLDCGAQLIHILEPRKGFVELTGSGTILFKQHAHELNVPVISIDDSKLKQLETFFGTADGFIRGFQQFSKVRLDNHAVVLFGYGKVGRGIVHGLLPFTKNILIFDRDPSAINKAKENGLAAILSTDLEKVNDAIKQADIVIAAVGINNCISKVIDPALLKNKILVSMSAEDDFGPAIANESVLGNKQPINFLLDAPTKMRYLDPSFYAHNQAALHLLTGDYAPGYHPLSPELDVAIVSRWQKIFNEDLSPLFANEFN